MIAVAIFFMSVSLFWGLEKIAEAIKNKSAENPDPEADLFTEEQVRKAITIAYLEFDRADNEGFADFENRIIEQIKQQS